MRFYRRSEDQPLFGRLAPLGLLLGAAAFAAALSPSLIPRSAQLQGVLAGLSFGCGYGIGAGLTLIWLWVVQPADPPGRVLLRRSLLAGALAALVMIGALWMARGWQNEIRAAMGMVPVETARPFTIAGIALGLGAGLVLLGRLFRRVLRILSAQAEPFLPRRMALFLSLAVTGWLFWSIGAGVLMDRVLGVLDRSYATLDATDPPDFAPPADPLKTGSAASLIGWDSLGAEGRNRIAGGPDAAAITAITGRPAMEPLRVYAGLNSAATPEARAALALRELIRIGGFARSNLVIAFPTGTGWVDPAGMEPVEYLTDGDIASVSVQYSYLPSWLSLLVEPTYGSDTARAVFRAVYGHWTALPRDRRPKLYLFGLSLGAMNGDLAADFYDMIGDPYQGALWVGPPFTTRSWNAVVADRAEGSPVWAPQFRDGSLIRFMAQEGAVPKGQAGAESDRAEDWGPVRIVYLQYPSDPIVMFRADMIWRQPAWMTEPRGPDVSPGLVWVPVVTLLQLLFDMMTATMTPVGHGHVYAAGDYLNGWQAVLGAGSWDAAAVDRLRAALAARGL
ncbi:MAG: alpha/beta-hydrolase family protein [Gemmobacter sp.]|nr:alpha/beta-hydrolase family protein [Gemmobacter sp.]